MIPNPRIDEHLPTPPPPSSGVPYCDCGKRGTVRLANGAWLCTPCADAEAEECAFCELTYARASLKFTRQGDGPFCWDCHPEEDEDDLNLDA